MPDPAGEEPIYLVLEDALALYAAIIDAEGQFLVDGNKRLALVAMLTFLELNGHRVQASDPDLAAWILDLATGTTPEQLAERIRAALTATGG